MAPQIKMGIRNSLFHLVDKRVTPSLAFMFDPTKIEQHLRQLITKTFPDIQNIADLQQQQLMFQPVLSQPQPPSLQGSGSAGINGHHYLAGSNQVSKWLQCEIFGCCVRVQWDRLESSFSVISI